MNCLRMPADNGLERTARQVKIPSAGSSACTIAVFLASDSGSRSARQPSHVYPRTQSPDPPDEVAVRMEGPSWILANRFVYNVPPPSGSPLTGG